MTEEDHDRLGVESGVAPDSGLMAAAALLLQRHGYRTRPLALPDARVLLLAENAYFVLGVAEFAHSAQLSPTEAAASHELAELVVQAPSGPKRWDIYLVLLSAASRSGEDMSEAATTIVYNTKYLRRIVRWDVTSEAHVMARALQAFLPLPPPPATRLASPMDLLVEKLPQFGVGSEAAELAVQQWREQRDREQPDE